MCSADIEDIFKDEAESANNALSKIVKDAFSEHYVASENECWTLINTYYNNRFLVVMVL